MALLFDAQLTPTKPELLRDWFPRASYGAAEAGAVTPIGAYRFDDPAGEVGMETHLVRGADGTVFQVPLTYRSAPLTGARLIAEMDHSVLGRRYIHDATTDPVYVRRLLAAVYLGEREAEQYVHVDGGEPVRIPGTAHVRGTGDSTEVPTVTGLHVTVDGTDTVIDSGRVVIVVHHHPLDAEPELPALVGEWDGGAGLLASVR